MIDFCRHLFDTSGFPARWRCGAWDPFHGYLHIVSDIAIFAAYTAIPLALVAVVWRRRDLPFPMLFGLFAAFILACGTSHLLDATMFWRPQYRLLGLVKAGTALVSWATVACLIPLLPRAFALKGPGQLEAEVARRTADLGRSRAETRAILNASLDAIVTFRSDGLIRDWNPRAEGLFGGTWEVGSGRRVGELFPGAAGDALRQAMGQDGAVGAIGTRLILSAATCDGAKFPAELSLSRAVAEGDDEPLFSATIRDVTESIRSRSELERLALVASRITNMVVITDAAGHIEWVNDSFHRITGFSAEEARGRKPGSFLQGERTDPRTVAMIRARLAEGQPVQAELVNYTKAGRPYWVAFDITPVRDALGRLEHFIAIESDVTARKQAEAELHQAKEAAEQATRAKSEFLANMSHELRTPLTAIIGYAEILREPDLSEERRDRAVETVRRSGQHLVELINNILDLSKIEAGRLEAEPTACSLVELAADVQSMMNVPAAAKSLDLSFTFLGAAPARVTADANRIKQILVNLIGNAIKFTEAGGVQVAFQAKRRGEPGQAELRIEVCDTGVGISEEALGRVFGAFEQADATVTRRHGGTGLGLAISRRLAGLLGGTLEAQSERGIGSTFTLTVPIGLDDATAWIRDPIRAVSAPPADAPAPAVVDLTGRRVLLAEDTKPNRELIAHLLTRAGAAVDAVEDGQQALDAALRSSASGRAYDVILMDMQMPVLDGYNATRRLRAAGYLGPVIALTAHAMGHDRDRCLAAGCSDHLAKPIDVRELLAGVDRWAGPDPSSSPEGESAINFPALLRRCAGDEAFAKRMLIESGAWIDPELDRIAEAIGSGEWPAVQMIAHALKGAAGDLGAERLSQLAGQVEQAVASDRIDTTRALLPELIAEWRRCGRDVQALIGPSDEGGSPPRLA